MKNNFLNKNVHWLLPMTMLFIFFVGLNVYYTAVDMPMQKYLTVTPHDSFGFVYTKDLPCGNGDVICMLGKSSFLTFTAPSSVNIEESFSIFLSNIGETWQGTNCTSGVCFNSVRNPVTNQQGDCGAAKATFWVEDNAGAKYSETSKNLVFATGAGNCYANSYYKINTGSNIAVGGTFKAAAKIDVLGYTKAYSKTVTLVQETCSSTNVHKCTTQSTCTNVGGVWCNFQCLDKGTICVCDVKWLNSPYCSSNNVYQLRQDLDCGTHVYLKEDCMAKKLACSNGACAGIIPPPVVCGDGVCDKTENSQTCLADCPVTPNATYYCYGLGSGGVKVPPCTASNIGTQPGSMCFNTLLDCNNALNTPDPTVCGNGVCETGEGSLNCIADCGGEPPCTDCGPDGELTQIQIAAIVAGISGIGVLLYMIGRKRR